LNRIVTDLLLESGLAIVSIQPSASARARAGRLLSMDARPICQTLQHDLVPLVFGDVALDEDWGSTIISTETIFSYLAPILRPQRILLVGQVPGVFSSDPNIDASAQMLSVIRSHQATDLEESLGGSHAADVTGGMRTKVGQMAEIVRQMPDLRVSILGGEDPGQLEYALTDPQHGAGTSIIH
jgi:isopentenyl phosphate kinase